MQSLPADEQAALYANLPRVQSQQRIADGKLGGLDHQGVYEVFLAAYGDEKYARDAQTKWLEQFVRDQCAAAANAGHTTR